VAVYAIGDVQGCHAELIALLERIAFDPGRDQLWFVGDLVNRGPQSLATLRFVRDLGTAAVVVLGNHDLHLLAVAHGQGRGLRRRDTLGEVLRAPDRDVLLDWLRRRPLVHYDPAVGFAMVHAGFAPEWTLAVARQAAREVEDALVRSPEALFADMYGDQPERWDGALAGIDRLRFIVNCCTRMRYVDRDGRLNLKLKGAPATVSGPWLPWFDVPGRRTAGERIVFGHWSTLGYAHRSDAWSLDSGCVWGGRLTALKLGPRPKAIQVDCPGYSAVDGD
jgi:bis(5'-nucleosyl)-tetraphosphatase (symmetrical)